MENAPRVPQHPSEDVPASPADELREEVRLFLVTLVKMFQLHQLKQVHQDRFQDQETNRPAKVERELDTTPTRVAVSYKTEEPKETQAEASRPEPVVEAEAVDVISETHVVVVVRQLNLLRRKITFESFLHFSITFPFALISAGGYFGYQYVQSSLLPVDANSSEYVTVQIQKDPMSKRLDQHLNILV